MKYIFLFTVLLVFNRYTMSQTGKGGNPKSDIPALDTQAKKPKILFGIASYYAGKFHGRQTANGEVYDSTKMTAACNLLPLGTWIRVTNTRNNRSVIVKTNDRMHPRMKRVVDLSQAAAAKLGYIRRGLTTVKVEVLEKK